MRSSTPRLEIELDKIMHNARAQIELYGAKGIAITAVTKGVCGSPEIASVLLRSGIRSVGDSRLANIQRMREAGLQAEFLLIRPPIPSEAKQVVELADASLNTEPAVIRLLAQHAAKRGKSHGILLMVELGDLREGILPGEVGAVVEEVLGLAGIELMGIGTNLACFGGVKPTRAKMQELSALASRIRRRYRTDCELVSGGNSANYQWFVTAPDVDAINHLRIGESILLGCDTVSGTPIAGLYTDAFTLVAEVIELKTKPSRPYGEIGRDAFGRLPEFEDRGCRRRAILALGEQDVDVRGIKPRIEADVRGASSDCLVLDVTYPGLKVGMEVEFDVNYSALLRAMTAPYVAKLYLPHDSPIDTKRIGGW